jgi:hypothetical protein
MHFMNSFRTFAVIGLACAACMTAAAPADGPTYTASGELNLPANYREWNFLSAGLGMSYGPTGETDANNNPRFTNVFVNRASYQSFLSTGTWPDNTMFLLDIRSSTSAGSINKAGRYQTDLVAIEAEVKDKGQWKFYDFGATGTTAKAFPQSESCYGCHSKNGAVDNTFVQFYPTLLKVAREKGTLKPGVLRETP